MADSFTSHYHLTKPEIGASRDTWGAKINSNLDTIDNMLAATTPIGVILDFAGANAPAGWLLADGGLYLINTYPSLYAVIGTRFGGDATHFNVPDTRARALVGVGYGTDGYGQAFNFAIGQRGGNNGAVIARANLPNYQLPETGAGTHVHTGYSDSPGDHRHTGATDAQGTHKHNFNAFHADWGGSPKYAGGGFLGGNYDSETTWEGDHAHNFTTSWAGAHQHAIQTWDGQGGHYHAPFLGGSGQVLQIITMYLACTKIIFAGVPATVSLALPNQMAQPLLRSPTRGEY